MRLTATEISELLSGTVHGNPVISVDDVCSLRQSSEGKVTFLSDHRQVKELSKTSASIVLVSEKCDLSSLETAGPTFIVVKDPSSAIATLLPKFRNSRTHAISGIHPTAVVDNSVTLGKNVAIGPQVTIAAGCKIGDNCVIHAGVSLAPDVVLKSEVTLHPNVVVYSGCEIGERVIIHAGAVIGADGFGYQFSNGAYHKIEHFGIVIIEQDVEIGACTTIDRGMIDNTIIHQGTKIDNQVMVAHNCDIGAHNILVSQVGFAGSISTGEYCRFGGQVGIADHVTVGKNSSLVAQAGVFRDIPEGATMGGSPACPMEDQKKIALAQMKLPELRQTVRKLEKRTTSIEGQLEASKQTSEEKTQHKAA